MGELQTNHLDRPTHCIVSLSLKQTLVSDMTIICIYVSQLLAAVCCKVITSTDTFLSSTSPSLSPLDGCLACRNVCTASPSTNFALLSLPFYFAVLFWPQSKYFPPKSRHFPSSLSPSPPTPICQAPSSDHGSGLAEKSVDLMKRNFSNLFPILSR